MTREIGVAATRIKAADRRDGRAAPRALRRRQCADVAER